MSSASGITLISESERNPMLTTTYGVGQLIKDAISRGCRSFIIGIGGSATNDGGAGMLEALGFSLLDKNGQIIPRGARGLAELAEIRTDGALKELSECEFSIACDVTNPLLGEHGCSAVFGPQKGADPDTVKEMDALLARYAALSAKITGKDLSSIPGAGAAGGLGFAFITFLGGRLVSGIDLVMQLSSLEEKIKESDVVVTGEGRLDGQSAMGKAPVGVARLAKKHGKRVIAFAGAVTENARECNECGIDAFFPVLRGVTTLEEALDTNTAYKNVSATAYQVFRLLI
jgi:glycerate kinase